MDFQSLCTSINDVVCHGIPSAKQKLKEGDIINVDVTPIVNGYHGDSSRTFFVGKPSPKIEKLVRITKECLDLGIETVKIGNRVGDIGAVIQSMLKLMVFCCKRFCWSWNWKKVSRRASNPHYGKAGTGTRFQAGMVLQSSQ